MRSACEDAASPLATALSTPWHNVGPRHPGEVCIVWRTLSSSGPHVDNQPLAPSRDATLPSRTRSVLPLYPDRLA